MTSLSAVLVVKRSPIKNVQNASRCNTVIENVNAFIGLHIKKCVHVRYQRQIQRAVMLRPSQNQRLIQPKSVNNCKI